MGYHTELNTLIGLPKDFQTKQLEVGKRFTITRERERLFPLHIAMLVVTHDWDFLGYAVVYRIENKDNTATLECETLSLFSEEERKLYKAKFIEAANKTGEIR